MNQYAAKWAQMNPSQTKLECYFMDVGQGASSVVLLGDQRAIVIDAGPSNSSVTLSLLNRYVETIEALVVTHNDSDHDGAVARILVDRAPSIETLYFLADRPRKQIRTLRTVKGLQEADRFKGQVRRLEAGDSGRGIIYSDSEKNVELSVIYPEFLENLGAEGHANRANRTSGILLLKCGTRRIVLSADAPIEAWEAVAGGLPSLPLTCDAMTASHHGGKLTGRNADCGEHCSHVRRVYSEIISPDHVIVSVGTSNTHGHPTPGTVETLSDLGVCVMCTQMTEQCCQDLEQLRGKLLKPSSFSASKATSDYTQSGRSRNVACAGSIVAKVGTDQVELENKSVHQRQIDSALALDYFQPLCRQG